MLVQQIHKICTLTVVKLHQENPCIAANVQSLERIFQMHRKQHVRNMHILDTYSRHLQSIVQTSQALQSPGAAPSQQCFYYSLQTSGRTGLTEVTFSLQYCHYTILRSTKSQIALQGRRADQAESLLIRTRKILESKPLLNVFCQTASLK